MLHSFATHLLESGVDIRVIQVLLGQPPKRCASLPPIHLTIMPNIDGFAFPALAKSGYQTLLPYVEGAAFWAEQLGLPQAPSVMTSMFGEVLSLASELGAMDQKRLGTETRPEEEVAARRSLEATFARKYEELTRRFNAFDLALQSDMSELIEHLRTGDVDFAAEAQAAVGGASSNIAEAAGYVSLLLMSAEIGDMSIDGKTIKRVYTTESEQIVDDQE